MSKLFSGKKKFVAKDHEEMKTFEAITPDWYVAKIIESEMKENSKKTGEFLKLKFQITEGTYKNRLIFINLNIIHTNEDAVEIAEQQLAAICNAIGVSSVEDSEELHGIEMQVKVAITPKTARYPEGNELKGFKAQKGVARPDLDSSESRENKPVKKKVTFGKN
jgi:hypothetical protein